MSPPNKLLTVLSAVAWLPLTTPAATTTTNNDGAAFQPPVYISAAGSGEYDVTDGSSGNGGRRHQRADEEGGTVMPPLVPPSSPEQMVYSNRVERGETRAFLEFLHNVSYDHRQRPEPDGHLKPTRIIVSVLVGSIRKVSEVTMDYSLELFFRETWVDPRLNYEKHMKTAFVNKTQIGLHESYAAFLWHPDTFIPNAIESTNPKDNSITHRSLLRLFPAGGVLYSRRISITAECPMDLTLFPFDQQICKLEIESYGYPDTEVVYEWDRRQGDKSPVQWNEGKIKLPDFELQTIIVNDTLGIYSTGNYSRLVACFFLSRSSGFCFLQLIIPATAVVVASWVSLWMENETTFQDMISVILTLTFLIYSYNTVMPRVSYIKAMDVYLGACFAFVFLSLIKLAIVKYMRQRLQIRTEHSVVCSVMPLLSLTNQTTATPGSPQTAIVQRQSPLAQTRIDMDLTSAAGNGTEPLCHTTSTTTTTANNNNNNNNNSFNNNHSVLHQPAQEPGSRLEYDLVSNRFCTLKFDMSCMRNFHLATQIIFPVAFIVFCSIYFITYPSIYTRQQSMCIP